MTLQTALAVSQIVGAVVVVATLIAILVEAYQTNAIAKADLTLQIWVKTGEMHYSLVDSPEKAEFLAKALSVSQPLTHAERLRFRGVMAVALGTHEAGHN